MSWLRTTKPKERYYLLAGMGGAPTRRKNRLFLVWSVVVAILVSVGLGLVLLLVNHLQVN